MDGPSIAVLPFINLGGEQDFIADGITEDIITGLARLRWLFVIARNSTFVYKGKAVDVRQVSRELGVRYVLEGSVRTAGGHIRITGQLIDAETGKHIWAEKYDRELRDLFAVQDDITERWWPLSNPISMRKRDSAPPASRRTASTRGGWSSARSARSARWSASRTRKPRPAAPSNRDGAELCPRACAPGLGSLVGRVLLLESRHGATGYRRAAGHAERRAVASTPPTHGRA